MIYDLVQVAPELTCHPLLAGLKLGGATLGAIAGRDVLGTGGDAVSSVGVPAWEQGVLSRVRPCLSFPAALALL